MKNRLKSIYFDMFIKALELESKIELSIPQKRAIANLLSSEAVHVHDANFDVLREEHDIMVRDHEKTRAQFIGFINFIEKQTKYVLEALKKNSLVSHDYDAVKKRAYLKGRTTVVQDMVVFLNKMNELVIKFYEDVYKIDLVDDKDKMKDNIQGSLF